MPASSGSRLSPEVKNAQLNAALDDALVAQVLEPGHFAVVDAAVRFRRRVGRRPATSGLRRRPSIQRQQNLAVDAAVAELGDLDDAAVDRDQQARQRCHRASRPSRWRRSAPAAPRPASSSCLTRCDSASISPVDVARSSRRRCGAGALRKRAFELRLAGFDAADAPASAVGLRRMVARLRRQRPA